jgi:hypothetical protein
MCTACGAGKYSGPPGTRGVWECQYDKILVGDGTLACVLLLSDQILLETLIVLARAC